MELMDDGKTKAGYRIDEDTLRLAFKDDMTGSDGVFDPGANEVSLSVEGAGKVNLAMSVYFFEKLEEHGIATHYIRANAEDATMTVHACEPFGHGLEVISRFKAVGSFYRRYSLYTEQGRDLDNYVEITVKDDKAGDPLITEDALIELGILEQDEYSELVRQTKRIAQIIRELLAEKAIELYDIKLEFGRDKSGGILLMDEISSGNMRAYHNGRQLEPFELHNRLLG